MKNNRVLLLVGLLAAVVVAYFLLAGQESKSTLDGVDNYTFTIEDTAAVHRIIIKDKRPTEVDLVRGDNGWTVNGKFKARKDAVEVLLETMNRMTLKNFTNVASREAILKNMSVYGKEVMLYDADGNEIKHFYVGTNTGNDLGTYMLIAGADQPYAVYIPGFNGYLSSRFISDEHLWRDRKIFGVPVEAITSVTMDYPGLEENSFRIMRNGEGEIQVLDHEANAADFNPQRAAAFLQGVSKANYEGMIIETDEIWSKKDSVTASIPVFKLTVAYGEGNELSLSGYHIKAAEGILDAAGNPAKWDADRMYGDISDGRFTLIQYFGLSRVLKSLQEIADPEPLM
ncbi:MAG: hypothetical protein SchgKO_24650 [Schleiferiaceae bacterium]